MTDSMVEKVARAMAEDLGYVWDTMPEKAHSTECAGRDFWFGCADVAIAAHEAALKADGYVIVPRESVRGRGKLTMRAAQEQP